MIIAATITRLTRRGITPTHLITWGNGLALLLSLLLILDLGPTPIMWSLFGLVYAAANLSYAAHAQGIPRHLTGRANTCLNLGVFICSFSLQWGFGALVDAGQAQGLGRAEALRLAWCLMLLLQAISLGWFVFSGRRQRAGGHAD